MTSPSQKKPNPLSSRQINALQELEYFALHTVDWSHPPHYVLSSLGIGHVVEDKEGTEADEAFFLKSDQGVNVARVHNVGRYAFLLSAQRWMAAQEKMWREGFEECTLNPPDFLKEPDHVFKLASKAARTAHHPFTRWKGQQSVKVAQRCKELQIREEA